MRNKKTIVALSMSMVGIAFIAPAVFASETVSWTGIVSSSGALSITPYVFSISKMLQANKVELNSVILAKQSTLRTLTQSDKVTRASNWTSFHAQYEKGVNKFLRKLTKTERIAVSSAIKAGKVRVDTAEMSFSVAQKNKDVQTMSGALTQIIQANNDRFLAAKPYIATASMDAFGTYIQDMNAVKMKNMTMRIKNTQSWLDISKEVDVLRNTLWANTITQINTKLAAIPTDLLVPVTTDLLAQIDRAEINNQSGTSTMKSYNMAQLEAMRSLINAKMGR